MATLRNKRILVTGGAGFIGSHLSLALAQTNTVVVYDNLASSVISPQELKKQNIRFIKGDIRDTKTLTRALKNVDMVFHLAVACVRVSLSDPTYVHDVNATGTLSALLAAKKAKVNRFVYISSSEVYGTALTPKMSETHIINPTTVYGMSKYMGELYTKYFFEHEGMETVIIRPFNTYGPRSHFDGVYGEVIPRFAIRALNKKQPTLFGSGKQTRDFTFVTDTVEGIMRAAFNNRLLGDSVNIAFGKEVTIEAIARAICLSANLSYQPIKLAARPNDVMRHAANIVKAKTILGFQPQISVAEGIRTYIDWIKKTYPQPQKLLSLVPNRNW
jgi:UDP-glucose 4-epimerase